ncbi:ribosomal L32p protein family-domain-containing protein [Epithele typhae]|uniref:ribosomal L32p protein family-domain-containing protein n=1 Tax=Epithele typhae TaxID=378194 RepID=UPI00200791CC|nr:ribosomal L32p protein family-domain-containing protein [Epithele typhae]KAH9944417.1 ribosomal L32p protein family-domain-containing protein [Epithele typhae]
MAAALALHQSRSWLAVPRLPLPRLSLAAAFLPSFLATQRPFTWAIPPLSSLLELFPPWLLAVPKKKVSHSRKNMRSANKGLKDKENFVQCPSCGSTKLAHHICPTCYRDINLKWKARKAEGSAEL